LAANRTRFLIPHFIIFPLFAFPPSGAVDKIVLPEGIQEVSFSGCEGITGTADLGRVDGHIYLIRFGGQPHVFPPSSFIPFPLFALPPAGAVDKIVLPEGIQEVNFSSCHGLTGTAEGQG
jgi:hypothetical protein